MVPVPSSPKVWSRMYASLREWQDTWRWRLAHGEDKRSWKRLCRGLVAGKIKDIPIPTAEAIIAGKATEAQILALLSPRIGSYWYLLGRDNTTLADSEEFAYAEEHFGNPGVLYDLEDNIRRRRKTTSGEVPVVLVARRPPDWHADDNKSFGLLGNSFLDPQIWRTLQLVQIRYNNGKRWISIPSSATVRL